MKRLALIAAVLVLAACKAKEETTPAMDTAAPATVPAPTTTDTTAPMADTTMKDTTAATKTP